MDELTYLKDNEMRKWHIERFAYASGVVATRCHIQTWKRRCRVQTEAPPEAEVCKACLRRAGNGGRR